MHPILFRIPYLEIDVRTYGVAMASAFVICIWLMSRRALRDRIDVDISLNAAFWLIIGTLVGGRLLFVVTQWHDYFPFEKAADFVSVAAWRKHGMDAVSACKLWKGGLVFYGGFIGSAIAAVLYINVWSKKRGMPIYDLFAPYVGIGLAIHRTFGCFLNGCCYGSPTNSVFGVHFPGNHPSVRLYGEGVHVHPAQLYEAMNGISIFILLMLWRNWGRKSYGELFGLMFVIYAINRFIIEFFRGDPVREFVGFTVAGWQFTTSQFIGLAVLPLGLAIFFWARFRGEKVGEENPDDPGSVFVALPQ